MPNEDVYLDIAWPRESDLREWGVTDEVQDKHQPRLYEGAVTAVRAFNTDAEAAKGFAVSSDPLTSRRQGGDFRKALVDLQGEVPSAHADVVAKEYDTLVTDAVKASLAQTHGLGGKEQEGEDEKQRWRLDKALKKEVATARKESADDRRRRFEERQRVRDSASQSGGEEMNWIKRKREEKIREKKRGKNL